jgi:hypothetical protein
MGHPHSNKVDPDKSVHRPLRLASPIERGADVRALQGEINEKFAYLKIDREIQKDGQLGGQTFNAATEIAVSHGVCGEAQEKLKRGILTESTQELIRGRRRSEVEVKAAQRRDDYRQKLRKRYSKSAGEKAIEKSAGLVGVHEEPSGSNYGSKVGEMEKFTGYAVPDSEGNGVFWCGCCACWIVVHLGGAKIPNRIRMGFAPYITADALAGANGFTAVSVHHAQPGDVGCLWGGEHVVTVREAMKPGDTMVKTREGNTSAADGSQTNGGEVADKERPISDFDHGIVARPDWS